MINSIIRKYDGYRNYWFPDIEESNVYVAKNIEELRVGCHELERNLLNKYKKYIPKGWYGFSLGSPLPKGWYNIIEEFLDYLIELENKKKIGKFEIHQIKSKFGGVKILCFVFL
jgi:hypothetical protein